MASKPGDTVFDPFMGVGSTAVAVRELGRQFIGAEIDEAYFEAAVRRLAESGHQSELPVDFARRSAA